MEELCATILYHNKTHGYDADQSILDKRQNNCPTTIVAGLQSYQTKMVADNKYQGLDS